MPSLGNPLYSRRGQSLVEALVALSFLTVGFMAVFSLLSRSLSLNRSSTESYVATYIAAEGIEIARNIVDTNGIQKNAWSYGFSGGSGDYEAEYNSRSLSPNQDRFLTYNPNSHIYGYGGSIQTPFKRLIRVTFVSQYEMKINSIVFWTGLGGGSFRVNLEDHFMNWRT
ncbi:MAG: hypothetical protein AAB536_00410 [Patescibacteria group bacterium]